MSDKLAEIKASPPDCGWVCSEDDRTWMIAEIERLQAAIKSYAYERDLKSRSAARYRQERDAAFEEAAKAVRAACGACDGKGGVQTPDGQGAECEYCGRPIAAIRAKAKEVRDD